MSNEIVVGVINPDGTMQGNSDFTSERNSEGNYTLSWPSGSWTSTPIPVAMPIANNHSVNYSLSSRQSDGSATIQLKFINKSGDAADTLFNFIAGNL